MYIHVLTNTHIPLACSCVSRVRVHACGLEVQALLVFSCVVGPRVLMRACVCMCVRVCVRVCAGVCECMRVSG